MVLRGSEPYTLVTEKFRKLKTSYRPQLKLKISYLDFERDRGRHCKITKLMSSQTRAFRLLHYIKFEILKIRIKNQTMPHKWQALDNGKISLPKA